MILGSIASANAGTLGALTVPDATMTFRALYRSAAVVTAKASPSRSTEVTAVPVRTGRSCSTTYRSRRATQASRVMKASDAVP